MSDVFLLAPYNYNPGVTFLSTNTDIANDGSLFFHSREKRTSLSTASTFWEIDIDLGLNEDFSNEFYFFVSNINWIYNYKKTNVDIQILGGTVYPFSGHDIFNETFTGNFSDLKNRDYVTKFTTGASTQYRYIRIKFTSIYSFLLSVSKAFVAKKINLGRNPSLKDFSLSYQFEKQFNTETKAFLSLLWENVNDSVANDIYINFRNRKDIMPVVVYDESLTILGAKTFYGFIDDFRIKKILPNSNELFFKLREI